VRAFNETRSCFFSIRPGMEAFTDGQPSLLLRVRLESELGWVDVLACRAK
jgi:hypothetical protein